MSAVWTGALIQLGVLLVNIRLFYKVTRANKEGSAQIEAMDEIIEKGEKDTEAFCVFVEALNNLLALQLAIRLKSPAFYW